MSANSHKNIENQEIDLTKISKGLFQNFSIGVFKSIQFVIKHIIILSILFVIGCVLGFYLDNNNKIYDNQIIVTPNFESTDFLYSRVDLLESKIKERDTLFLKSIGIQEPKKLLKIKIEPIVDIYRFVNTNSDQNFELLKLMAEDGDIKKIAEDKMTSKNYSFHEISFSTKDITTNQKTISPILNFLNNSNFYKKIQKEYVNKIKVKREANTVVINQIEVFLNSFSDKINGGNSKNDKLVYYNENTQLNDVINTKNKLITEQGNLRVELVSLDKIIKENSQTLNIENKDSVNGKLKIILPLFLIFIFVFIHFFISFYKRQSEKEYNN